MKKGRKASWPEDKGEEGEAELSFEGGQSMTAGCMRREITERGDGHLGGQASTGSRYQYQLDYGLRVELFRGLHVTVQLCSSALPESILDHGRNYQPGSLFRHCPCRYDAAQSASQI